MKRYGLSLALSLACLGCVEFDMHMREPPPRPVTPVSAIAIPITAQQVTPANARQMAQQLSVEIDQEDLAPPVAADKRK